jgi:dTDP-glucose 4,6-dehydratase
LIYGAGESGNQITRLFAATPESTYRPIGFLDDDPAKRRLHMNGLRVLGTIEDLEAITRSRNVGVLVVAIAGIGSPSLLALDRRCSALGITLRVIPTATEIVGGAVSLGDISQVTEEDLLGRRPIHTDEEAIASFIAGKRVLITGAGGSIGSELARQVTRYQPAFLGLLDRDESALQAVQLSLDGRGLLDSEELMLADIRDADRIRQIFDDIKPDVVFHAAALKHLPLLQSHPEEGFKTNVLGTAHVLSSAQEAGVPVLINISTDKAADPTSVLGRTKQLTEQMTAGTATGDRRYLSVRFGNVLGSRGSVLNTFREQIAQGGPVTVTDPEVTRYFMTISEAVHLVLQAAAIGEPGETLVLDMGTPVRIKDVAEQMIQRSGRSIDIAYTGLRPGEKLHEVLISESEPHQTRVHPLIQHTRVEPIKLEEALQAGEAQVSGPGNT